MAGYRDFAFFYDLLMKNADYESRFGYIIGLLAENGIGKGILLDMACGTGTLSKMFAQKGFDVVGIDASEEMLSRAQEKKLEENFDALFLCQKMEELDMFGTVDAAVCTLDSLNTLYKHRRVLENNAFVFDTENVFCVWQNTLLGDNETTQINLDIFEGDEEEEDVYIRYSEEFFERGYELDFLKKTLENYRFEVVGIYDDMTKEPVREDSERAIFVCKKHGTQFV